MSYPVSHFTSLSNCCPEQALQGRTALCRGARGSQALLAGVLYQASLLVELHAEVQAHRVENLLDLVE